VMCFRSLYPIRVSVAGTDRVSGAAKITSQIGRDGVVPLR
jgi:hypothetical protein